jgi:uncharacterized membrane protein
LKRNVLRGLALILVIAVAMGVAGVIAYHYGATTGPNMPMMRGFGGRGHDGGWTSDGGGFGLVGLLALAVIGVLFFWLLAALLAQDHARSKSVGSVAGTPAADVDRIRELSELHTAGRLTDDEFTAAKRKLLGM